MLYAQKIQKLLFITTFVIGINLLTQGISFAAFADSSTLRAPLTVAQTQQCTTTYVNPYKTGNFSCSNMYYANSCKPGDVVTGVYSHGSPILLNQCQFICATPQKTCVWNNA